MFGMGLRGVLLAVVVAGELLVGLLLLLLKVRHELSQRQCRTTIRIYRREDALECRARAALLPHVRWQLQPISKVRVAAQRQQ